MSRIGNKVQCPAMKELSSSLRLEYLRFSELQKVTRFKANVSSDVSKQLRQGEVLTQLFSQENNRPYPLAREVILLYALNRQVLNDLGNDELENLKKNIYDFVGSEVPGLIEDIVAKKDLTMDIKKKLDDCFVSFFKTRDTQGVKEQ